MIEEKFQTLLAKEGYFNREKRVLLALSGGLDSMTLLNLLLLVKNDYQLEIHLAHVNHGQRLESDDEEKGIIHLAQQLDLPLHLAHYQGTFSEAKARQFRYDFFKKVMEKENCKILLTAHHADDQAETILMKLIRGSKGRYLAGIKPIQDFGPGKLIRPLLGFKKEEFTNTFHFEDLSNYQNHYLRNRIRNHYIPQLEKENPQFKNHLLEMGAEFDRVYSLLDQAYQDFDIENLPQFKAAGKELQIYLLEKYLLKFPDLAISKQQFQEVLKILTSKANYQGKLKNGYFLYKDYSNWSIQKISPEAHVVPESYMLEYGNTLETGAFRFSFGIEPAGKIDDILYVSRETPLLLRNRKEGDVILLGGHHKKINRYFIDKKVPTKDRDQAVLILQNDQLLGIAGMLAGDLSRQAKHDIMKDKLYIQRIR